MTPGQRQTENLILIALAKAFSEQSTALIGTKRHEQKAVFNNAVNAIDLFIRLVESQLSQEEQEYLTAVGDIYHNINIQIRKEANAA